MPKRKVSNSKRKTRKLRATKSLNPILENAPIRFLGLSLCGGKTNKTCLAVLEYFPLYKKLFLTQLHSKIENEANDSSSDAQLYNLIKSLESSSKLLAINVPLQLPKCLRCPLKCPGYENCEEPEIKWLWKMYRKKVERKKTTKLFTPYTERCAEYFIASELEESFFPSHAMGANSAPLLARGLFLKRRLKINAIEVFPKLSIWRIGLNLNIQKSHLRYHKHAFGGDESRAFILKTIIEKNLAFIYEQDRKTMVDNNYAFEAFVCAITAFLKYQNQCENKPNDFPLSEAWIDFPKQDITWHNIFGSKEK